MQGKSEEKTIGKWKKKRGMRLFLENDTIHTYCPSLACNCDKRMIDEKIFYISFNFIHLPRLVLDCSIRTRLM